MSNERIHHPYGSSRYPVWELCACHDSIETSTCDASQGTYSHDVLEALNKGLPIPSGDGVANVTDLVGRAEWAREVLLDISFGNPIHAEEKVSYEVDETHGEIFSYCDAWFEVDDELYVADYKTFDMGNDDLFAQHCGYALGIAQKFPKYAQNTIHLVLLAGGARRVVTAEVTYTEALRRVKAAIDRRDDPNATPSACKHCKTCRYARTCKGADLALTTIQDKPIFSKLSIPEQWVVIKGVKQLIANYESDIKQRVREAGGRLSGGRFTLVLQQKNGQMKFNDIPALASRFKELGIAPSDFIKLCSVSKTSLVSALRAKGEDGRYIRSEKEAVDILRPFATIGTPSEELKIA